MSLRGRSRTIVLSLIGCAVALLFGEALARIAETVADDVAPAEPEKTCPWLAYAPDVGWVRRPGFNGEAGGAPRAFDAAGYRKVDSAQVAARGSHRRAIFLGDSNTFGFGVPTEDSFVEVVDRRLEDVDAINLGVIGYSSYQGRVALEQALTALEPDVVVVSFNFNDRRYVMRFEDHDGAEEFGRVYRRSTGAAARLAGVLQVSHLVRGLRRVMVAAHALPAPVTELDVTQLVPRVDEASYRDNLAQMAAAAQARGIPILFLLLGDDPIRSDHARRGIESLDHGDPDQAIAYLKPTIRAGRMFADLARIHLVRAFEAKGEKEKAAAAARTRDIYASFSGGRVVRLDTEYQAIMRAVAAESDVELVDGAAVLAPHPSMYLDFCHFDAEAHRLVGELLADRIRAVLDGPDGPAPAATGGHVAHAAPPTPAQSTTTGH